jgi:hypothetical protein
VIESLVKANAMASLGTAGALLDALDASLENGARHQRDVAAGQSTLFDLFALPAESTGTAFLDGGDDIPKRERLRWEKELIGLYLSEHPLGDIATEMHEYVTADVADLAEEEDQSRVTIGGIVAGSRRIVTKAGSTMLVPIVEDLTGSVEVVVFPKVYEQTVHSWADDAVVLVAGRIDRRDETPQILCEAVWSWDDAVSMGPIAFGTERDRSMAPRRRWNGGPNGSGGPNGNGGGEPAPRARRGPGQPPQAVPIVAPERVAVAVATDPDPSTAAEELSATVGAPAPGEDPPAPIDARPIQAAPASAAATIAVSIGDDVPVDQLLGAIESVKSALAVRPGPLPVVLNLSVAGAVRQVRLPDRVAWDERLGEAVRRAAGVPVAVELQPETGERLA